MVSRACCAIQHCEGSVRQVSRHITKRATGITYALVGALILGLGSVACSTQSAGSELLPNFNEAPMRTLSHSIPSIPDLRTGSADPTVQVTPEQPGLVSDLLRTEFRPTNSIRGLVSGTNGSPVQGAWVEFKVPGCAGCTPFTTTTNAKGRYSIKLPAGVYIAFCGNRDPMRRCVPPNGGIGPYSVQVPPFDQTISFKFLS